MIEKQKLSPLELAVLEEFHKIYNDQGFPPACEFFVSRRHNTGAGRYVDLITDAHLNISNGYIDMKGRYIEMEGVPDGMMAVVYVSSGKPHQLELVVYGDTAWDGTERSWSIV